MADNDDFPVDEDEELPDPDADEDLDEEDLDEDDLVEDDLVVDDDDALVVGDEFEDDTVLDTEDEPLDEDAADFKPKKPAKKAADDAEEGEEGEEDDDDVDPDDVEADLDTILKDRLVVAEDEDDDEEEVPEVDERGETTKVRPRAPGEFVCQSCFLVKHPSQLADADRQLCRDCV